MSENVPQLPRNVNFDLQNNQAEQSVYLCRRNGDQDYTEIGNQVFLTELKNSTVKEILLFVHGYSNLPEPAIFPRVEKLQSLFEQKSPGHTLVIPVIWPCKRGSGVLNDYFDDEIAADQSGIAFSRLFQMFLTWRDEHSKQENPCTKHINILAHSMGARVSASQTLLTVKP